MRSIISVLVSTAILGLAPQLAAQISLGDSPEFTFRQDVQNGMGIKSLAELQGKPVLIDFWGTR
jgi:hypothetical protein